MAKVIAVADTYAALTADRPYRPALHGHHAVKRVLQEVQAGRLDRAAGRALLDTVSLFPVGTRVGLTDGRQARVLRAVPDHSTRPVVVIREDAPLADWELDLSRHKEVAIHSILDPEAAAAA
jgi:HD-GYP domain-containing protein (c-di-GMP phosphodiesterase class II)